MSEKELSDWGRLAVIRDRYGENNPMIGIVETLINLLEDCENAGMSAPMIDWQRVEAWSLYCAKPVAMIDLLVKPDQALDIETADDGTITVS